MKVPGVISSVLALKSSSSVWTISPDSTVFDAVQMMDGKNVGAVPVMEAEHIIGMLSERDYTRKVVVRGKSSKDTKVREIMASPVVTASPQQSVDECLRLMTQHRVRHLPVLEGERLVGIVSIGDLVNWVISAQSAAIDHLEGYISGRYPA